MVLLCFLPQACSYLCTFVYRYSLDVVGEFGLGFEQARLLLDVGFGQSLRHLFEVIHGHVELHLVGLD